MPDISKIQLPGSGGVYNIKDAVAREMISGGVSFIIAWDGVSAPNVGAIPQGVTVKYNNVNYIGTLDADDESVQAGAFYLVRSSTTTTGAPSDVYDEYVPIGTTGDRTWEKIGDTQVDLSNVVTNVFLNQNTDSVLGTNTTFTTNNSNVTFSGGTTDQVLGADTTFSAGDSSVTFSGGTTDRVLGEATTFTTSVTPTTTYLGTVSTSDDFVTSVTAETDKNLVTTSITGVGGTENVSFVSKNNSKLVTTTVPNIESNTDVTVPVVSENTTVTANNSTWSFSMGSDDAAETLIISGGNGNPVTATNTSFGTTTASKVTLGTAKTVATGTLAADGTGSDVLSGLSITPKTVATAAASATTVATGATSSTGTGAPIVTGVSVGNTAKALTGVSLEGNATTSAGRVQVATGIQGASTSATTSGEGSDIVAAVTNVGTGTAAGQVITVGTNDRPTVVKTIGTATAAAQTINVGTNDTVTVLTDGTSINVTKGNE